MPDAPFPLPPDDRPRDREARPDASADLGAGATGDVSTNGAPVAGAPLPGPDETPENRLRRRVTARRVGYVLAGLIVVASALVVAAVAYLRSDGGRERVRTVAVAQIAELLADDATVRVADVDGNFLTGARLVGLEVERGGEVILAVDTVRVRYTLRTLLDRTFSASALVVAGPRLVVRQFEDGTFNTAGLLKPAQTNRKPFTVLVDALSLSDGRAEVHWYNEGRDSTLVVDGVRAEVRDFVSSADSLGGRIEALDLAATATDRTTRMAVSGAGRFSRSDLVLSRLTARSTNGTRLSGSARAGFGEAVRRGDALPVFEANLQATPFALADARAFAGLPLYGDPRLRLTADSDGGTLTVSLRGSLAPETGGPGGPEASIALDGELTRATDGPVRYRAEGQLRRFDPAVLTRNPALAADLTGDLTLSLEGSSLRALDGPFRLSLRESEAAGRRIDRLTVDGAFAAGRVSFDVDGAIPGLDLVAEGESRPFDRVPTFALRGRARDVNLGVLLPGQNIAGRLAGDVAVEGRGTSVETFAGTAALGLGRTDVTVGGRRYLFDRVDLDADVRDGRAAYDADVVVGQGGGRLVAAGTVDPTGNALRYTVDAGRVERFNVAAITGNPAQASSLTGTFTVDGTGTDVRTLALDASANLRGSTFGAYTIASADVDARLRNGALSFDAAADLGASGALTAAGTAQPFSDPLAYEARGTLRRLDLAGITRNPALASSLTGEYEATGRGIDPQTLTLDARVRLAPSSVGERLVDATDLRASVRAGMVTLAGTVDTPDGRFALNATTRPFDASPAITLGEGTCFSDLDAGRLTNNARLSTDLNGCATGRVSGYADLQSATADLVVSLRPSRVNDARIAEALADITLARGALAGTLDATLDAADLPPDTTYADTFPFDGTGGRVTAAFQGRPFDDVPTYAVRGRTRGLDIAAVAGIGGGDGSLQRTNLSVDFDVDGRGRDPRTLRLAGSITGLPSVVGPARIDALDARFALAAGILTVDTLAVRSNLATANGSGTVALFDADAASDFRLAGQIENLDALSGRIGQPVALDGGAFDLAVMGVPGQPLDVVGRFDAARVSYGTTVVDELAGRLAATVNRAALQARGLDALTDGAVAGSAEVAFEDLTVGKREFSSGRATARLADVGGATAVALDAFLVVDERRDVELVALVELPAEATDSTAARLLTVRLERARASIDTATWALVRPATITVGDGLRVDSLLVLNDQPTGGGQRLEANGVIRFSGAQDFTLSAREVDLSLLSDLAGLGGLGGELAADLRVTGTAEAPLLDGTVGVRDIRSGDETVGALQATFGYADGQVSLDGAVTHTSGQQLTFNGAVPRRISLLDSLQITPPLPTDEVRFVARADSFPIAWARPFLNELTFNELGGALKLDLAVTGTEADPRLAGTAALTGGRLGIVKTGLTYAPITADVAFTSNRIELQRVLVGEPATANDSTGEDTGGDGIDITGAITLQSLSVGELDLTISPREFTAMDTRTYRALVLGAGPTPLRLTGTLAAPVLRGSVALSRGDIYVTDELVPPRLEDVSLTDADIATLEARFGRDITARDTTVNRFTRALDYDLQVSIDRNVWIRSEAGLPFDIEFSGDVQATKRAFAEQSQLFGRIELVRGEIQTLARRFQIDSGTLDFSGPALSAVVDIQASLDIKLAQSLAGQSAATVLLGVNGQLDRNPEVRLSSDPALDPADIVSLIATGQLAGQGGGTALGVGAGFGLGYVSGAIEGLASRRLGLDLAQVDITADGAVVLRVGKYLSNRIFLTTGYVTSRASGSSRSEGGVPLEATLDYELYRWLQAQIEYSGQRGLGGGANVEVAF